MLSSKYKADASAEIVPGYRVRHTGHDSENTSSTKVNWGRGHFQEPLTQPSIPGFCFSQQLCAPSVVLEKGEQPPGC